MDAAQSLFSTVNRDARIYVALGASERVAPLLPQLTADFPHVGHRAPPATPREPGTGVAYAHAGALENNAPPSVLVDSTFKILHLSPNAGRFFRPLEGPLSADLSAQVRPELRVDLKLALQRAARISGISSSLTKPLKRCGSLRSEASRSGSSTILPSWTPPRGPPAVSPSQTASGLRSKTSKRSLLSRPAWRKRGPPDIER